MLRINNQPAGPFSESEIQTRLQSGFVDDADLCAEVGTENWVPIAEAIPARKTVRLARKNAQEEAAVRAEKSEKIDPDLRKKLLLYNLADAISVDKFTPAQAEAAVKFYEDAHQKDKKVKIIAATTLGVLVFAGVFALCSFIKLDGAPNRHLLAPLVELMLETNPAYEKNAKATAQSAKEFIAFREEIENLEFRLPAGNDPRSNFVNAVKIPEGKRTFITGTLDTAALRREITPPAGTAWKESVFRVERINSDVRAMLREEIALIKMLNSPLWSDEVLQEKTTAALAAALPSRKETAVLASERRNRLKSVRVETIEAEPKKWAEFLERKVISLDRKEQYHSPENFQNLRTRQVPDANGRNRPRSISAGATESVHIKNNNSAVKKSTRASATPRTSTVVKNTVEWCLIDMPDFLDKFQHFIDTNKLNFSAPAREKAWADFQAQKAQKISEAFEKSAANAVPLDATGAFKFYAPRADNLCAKIESGKFVFFVPQDLTPENSETNFITFKDTKRVEVKAEDLLMSEQYRVARKFTLGNDPAVAEGRIMKKRVPVVRYSPTIRYIEVVRADEFNENRPSKFTLIVPDEAFFNELSEGATIPMEKLLTLKSVSRATEPGLPGKLSPMSPEEIAAYNAKKRENSEENPPADADDKEEEDSKEDDDS